MKNYKEMADSVFQRSNEIIMKKRKKRKQLVGITSAISCCCLVALLGISAMHWEIFNQTPSTITVPGKEGESNVGASEGHKAYPYEDKIQVLPDDMLVSKFENGFFAYNQEKGVTNDTASIYKLLYGISKLHRDCHPIFGDDGSVSFSRKSYAPDTDENRYSEMQNYLGKENESLFFTLSKLPQNSSNSIQCLLLQNGKDRNTTAVGAEVAVYENCVLNVIVSHDFNSINDDNIRARIDNMRKLLNTDTASQIDDTHLAISYVYQTRHSKELNADEESYIYYAFIQQNGYEYLIQFTTNYTVPGSNESAYGVKGRSQAECKATFEDIIINHILSAEK